MSTRPAEAPYHVLMDESGTNVRKRQLDRKLQRDYLSQRYRAYEQAKNDKNINKDSKDVDNFWCGATTSERALAACCCYLDYDDDEEEPQLPGALHRKHIAQFIGLLALSCNDVKMRALALAILERTQEAEEIETQEAERSAKRARIKEDGEGGELEGEIDETPPSMNPSFVQVNPKLKPARLLTFIKSGGLKILARWLSDATKPVSAKHLKGGNSKASSTRRPRPLTEENELAPSPTAPILLPLLTLLKKLPFDRQAITQSQINKKIKRLHKELDAVNSSVKTKSAGDKNTITTSPIVGAHSVQEIQAAVKDVMNIWEERATKAKGENSKPAITPPEGENIFVALQTKFEERLQELKVFESVESSEDMPVWIAQARAAQKKYPVKTKAALADHLSIKEREARERANERKQLHLYDDLKKTQQERAELLRKLRARKVQPTQPSNHALHHHSRKGVRWKDGLNRSSTTRKRQLLEEVFEFIRDKDVRDTAQAAETESDAGSTVNPSGEEGNNAEVFEGEDSGNTTMKNPEAVIHGSLLL
jgi:hypothetical protein